MVLICFLMTTLSLSFSLERTLKSSFSFMQVHVLVQLSEDIMVSLLYPDFIVWQSLLSLAARFRKPGWVWRVAGLGRVTGAIEVAASVPSSLWKRPVRALN